MARTVISRRQFAAGAAAAALLAPASARAGELHYVSDYISFVGEDESGKRFYFALDTNRGRDGDTFQANHFLVAFDERTGFSRLKGNGVFDNHKGQTRRIPPSPHFIFAGTPETGLKMTSPTNATTLDIAPLQRTLLREPETGVFWVGGADATLVTHGRSYRGRVIFEGLFWDNWNRFTRKYPNQWNDFHGIYLKTDGGRDFYVHKHLSEAAARRSGKLVGMATWDTPGTIANIDFKVAKAIRSSKGGFDWPLDWDIGFDHAARRFRLRLTTRQKHIIWNWEKSGFAMSILDGEIRAEDGSARFAVTGWGELLI
jgi:hypothetical protein